MGLSVGILHRYKYQNLLGWVLLTAGVGSWISVDHDSGAGKYIGFQMLTGFGIGTLFGTSNMVVMAPLPASLNAAALGFFVFTRQFWSVSATFPKQYSASHALI